MSKLWAWSGSRPIGVPNREPVDDLPVVHVLGIQRCAAREHGGGDDHAVVHLELEALGQHKPALVDSDCDWHDGAFGTDAGKLGIGVDSNQNYLPPGNVLTSMLKRVDVATYNAFMDEKNGKWSAGTIVLGLAEEGVGAAFDDNNAKLITPEMKAAVDAATAKIKSGELVVHDYMADKTCPS